MPTHKINYPEGSKRFVIVHTEHVYPPIPIRQYDWSAVTDNYDGAPDAHCRATGPQLVGTGATEQEAIASLLDEIAEYDAAYEADEAADAKREERL